MTDQELLQAMKTMIKEELEPINKRLDSMEGKLDSMEGRLDSMEETLEATKDGVNTLLEWAEECSTVLKFPLPRIANAK